MSGPQPAPGNDEDGPGILGNLPRTRPSVRSPRRAQPVRPAADAGAKGAAKSPRDGETTAASAGSAPSDSSREQELEELARAGLSLAGGAATLGLRVAGRAAAALRGAVERK